MTLPPSPVDPTAFREAVGRFATGVCVVTTVHDGVDHAMTANAFTSVSLDPLLVLVCVEKAARFHEAVLAQGEWAVSILDPQARSAAQWLARRGRPLQGQLDGVPHRPGTLVKAPLLEQAVSWLECRTHAVHPGGDHSIIVGEVVAVATAPGRPAALGYHRGAWIELA